MEEELSEIAKYFFERPSALSSFLSRCSVGEPTEQDYEEPEIEVISDPALGEEAMLEVWREADTLVWDSPGRVFSSEESIEFQATWAICKLVPGPWDTVGKWSSSARWLDNPRVIWRK